MDGVNSMSAKRTKPANVPVILQMEAVESGAASLCMILAYYKKWQLLMGYVIIKKPESLFSEIPAFENVIAIF